MEIEASVQPVVAIEKVFYRERAAGMHSAFPYDLDMYFTKVSGFIREISVSYI